VPHPQVARANPKPLTPPADGKSAYLPGVRRHLGGLHLASEATPGRRGCRRVVAGSGPAPAKASGYAQPAAPDSRPTVRTTASSGSRSNAGLAGGIEAPARRRPATAGASHPTIATAGPTSSRAAPTGVGDSRPQPGSADADDDGFHPDLPEGNGHAKGGGGPAGRSGSPDERGTPQERGWAQGGKGDSLRNRLPGYSGCSGAFRSPAIGAAGGHRLGRTRQPQGLRVIGRALGRQRPASTRAFTWDFRKGATTAQVDCHRVGVR